MNIVNSVLGPIRTSDLGFVLAHEHIMVSPAGVSKQYPQLLGGNMLERAIEVLQQAKAGGVDTIVDGTTTDLGRDVQFLAEAARRSGVQIITCTGWWLDIPRWFDGVSADRLADVFAYDIEKGIAGTDIKAGILKSAADAPGVTPEVEIMLRAVARAHRKTGAPIMLHSNSPGQVGRQQLAMLREEGVDLKWVKMDHSNDTTDIGYLTWLIEQGCHLGMDRYPGRGINSATRTKTLATLIAAGFANRLCPSHDLALITIVGTRMEGGREPNPHQYLYIKKVVLPQLKGMGVPDAILDRLCFDGPRSFFEGN